MSFFDSNFIVPMNFNSKINLVNKIENDRLDILGNPIKITNQSNTEFKDIFTNAIKDVIDTDNDYVNKQYLLATGQIDNAADVTIAGAKAQLAVDLLVQLRNSALTAYNEVLRINV